MRPKVDTLEFAGRKARAARNIARLAFYGVCRQSDSTWRYIANLRPCLAYRRIRKPMNSLSKRLLADLRRDGIVMTSVDELTGNGHLFQELETAVWKYESSLADQIDKARKNVNLPGQIKSYRIKLLGSRPSLDTGDIFVRFALQPEVMSIVNSYFGMLARLRAFNVWHNVPTNQPPRDSQLWHRDPEDRCVLKMFVFLHELDETSGPLSYVPGTHALGTVKADPESHVFKEGRKYVKRSDDEQMNALVPQQKWITATGPKGTIVLVDTRGYHKGGAVSEHDRLVYLCMFTSQASTLLDDAFKRDCSIPPHLDESVAFALGGQ